MSIEKNNELALCFNSNDDIATLFEDTAIAIKNNGYSGIMILYDEFGSFLENKNVGFAKDLNIIQGFAEKCNTSKN